VGKNKPLWTCFICGAVQAHSADQCTAPEHDLKLEIARRDMRIAQLEGALADLVTDGSSSSQKTSVDSFIDHYTDALRDFMSSSYDNTKLHHPEDLSAAMSSFTDAWFAIFSNSWRTEK
jgi:hypothetical protein